MCDFPALEAGAVPCHGPFMRLRASSTATHYGFSAFSRSFANSVRPNLRATSNGKLIMTLRHRCGTDQLSDRETLDNRLSMSNISRLVALIGSARTKDIIFTARLIEAPEALAHRLFNEMISDVEVLKIRSEETARLLASHAPLTLK